MATKSQNRRRLAAAAAAASETTSTPLTAPRHKHYSSPPVSPSSSSSQDDDNDNDNYTYTPSSAASSASTSPRSHKPTPPRIAIEQDVRPHRHHRHHLDEDLPPIVTYTASSSSVNTYDSAFSDVEGDDLVDDDDDDDDDEVALPQLDRNHLLPPSEGDDIPPVLPPYRASVADPSVRPSTPHAFAKLFPSMDRLSVRHDDLTPDGNMNLRVDTIIPGSMTSSASSHHYHGRRRHSIGPVSVQLFHLRMHDLARRDFSLRRYCRDSGREVCSSKRAYVEAPPASRSVSTALRSVKTPFQRSSTNTATGLTSGLFHRRPSTGTRSGSSTGSNSSWDETSSRRRRGSVSTIGTNSDRASITAPSQAPLVPTETMKLEFSNYARVEVSRHGDKKYEFDWWGHSYAWRRVVDDNLDGAVSFHLVRDGRGPAVAHIVPETRSPNQVAADEAAGGWIPPCHMWISDQSIVEAMTDVADVIVATGLIALVDDCIKQRWHVKKPSRIPHMAQSLPNDTERVHPRGGLMSGLFHRRNSEHHASSPLRFSKPVAAC